MGLTIPHDKNNFDIKCHKGSQTWMDSLDKRPKLRKIDMRFSTWNAGNIYRAGSLLTVMKEISQYSGRTGSQTGQGWH
jgi:hypothetical protein